jgi:hypothetical protein
LRFTTYPASNRIVIAFFRNNQIVITIPLALYVLLTHGAAFLGFVVPTVPQINQGGVLYDLLFQWATDHTLISAGVAAILVFIQALLVNNLADEFRILNDRNWLPGMFFVLVTAILPDFLFLSPPLVATFFVPISIRRILQVYKTPNAIALIFDTALWITVGVLFYPHALFLLIAALAGLNVMRSFAVREQLVFVSAIFVATVLVWLGCFWYDVGSLFIKMNFVEIWGFYNFGAAISIVQYYELGFLLFLFLIVLLGFSFYYSRKLIQTQKSISVLYWFFLMGSLGYLLSKEPYLAHFMIVMPSVGIFLAMGFMAVRSRVLAEIFHLILLGALFFLQFFPF